ncbi:MAG: hypothetical protein KatS3mg111_1641 [Pirellulaceae bacterium]|nr:MAG: hypothetical protein KatS3mg111_1641 [Pirellulaceae bacterium]
MVEQRTEDQPQPENIRPELPDCGTYLAWPTEGEAWIHPEDVEQARRLIPSRRVFWRIDWDGQFYHLEYGSLSLRVRPALWTPVSGVDLHVGQQIEVLANFGENEGGIYRIGDILYRPEVGTAAYYLQRNGMRLQRPWERRALRPLKVKHHLRTGFYSYDPPRLDDESVDIDFLHVGDLE